MEKILRKFPISLESVNFRSVNININHRLFLYFLLGVCVGTILINFIAGANVDYIGIYSEYSMKYIGNWQAGSFDKWSFFLYCIKKNTIEIAVILVMNHTSIYKIFNYCYCIYKGMTIAIFVSSATLTYGAGGMLLYIMSVFPHYFVYVPMIVFTLIFAIRIKEKVISDNLLMPILKVVTIDAILIMSTSFLESYFNYPFLRGIFN